MGGWISVSGIIGRPQVGDINLGLVTKGIGLNEMTRERKEDQNQALGCLRPVEKEELGVGENQECGQDSRREEKSVSGRRMPCFHDMSLNAGGDGNREETARFGLMEVNGELRTGCPLGMLA